jgi:hypothetical protein
VRELEEPVRVLVESYRGWKSLKSLEMPIEAVRVLLEAMRT